MTDVYSDWSSHQEFYSFSSGRFVYDEKEQVTQRETQFDANELARIAAEAIGSKECVEFQKYTDGLYNKVFVLTMDDGKEVIAKIPCSNAGLPHFTTASEVATMDFVSHTIFL